MLIQRGIRTCAHTIFSPSPYVLGHQTITLINRKLIALYMYIHVAYSCTTDRAILIQKVAFKSINNMHWAKFRSVHT